MSKVWRVRIKEKRDKVSRDLCPTSYEPRSYDQRLTIYKLWSYDLRLAMYKLWSYDIRTNSDLRPTTCKLRSYDLLHFPLVVGHSRAKETRRSASPHAAWTEMSEDDPRMSKNRLSTSSHDVAWD